MLYEKVFPGYMLEDLWIWKNITNPNGKFYTILMKDIWGKDYIKTNYTEPRLGDLINGIADINKAKEFLKFTPEFDIHAGLKEYLELFRQERNLS